MEALNPTHSLTPPEQQDSRHQGVAVPEKISQSFPEFQSHLVNTTWLPPDPRQYK